MGVPSFTALSVDIFLDHAQMDRETVEIRLLMS